MQAGLTGPPFSFAANPFDFERTCSTIGATWSQTRLRPCVPASTHDTLTEMAFRRSRSTKIHDAESLYEYAVGALGRKMRTVAELKRLMRERVRLQENGNELIEVVVERLKQQRYLNDTQYATIYSRYRQENERFGRMRVVQDLKIKGVHPDVIEKTVGESYSGVNEEELARKFLAKKRTKKPKDQKETARVFRLLVRAGFSSRAIIKVLKSWDVEEETLTAMEQERADAEVAARSESDE
jgi:regulatory protein